MQLAINIDATRSGTSDGRYTLRRELARGGMGRIWIADDARLSRRVAIKELLESGVARQLRFERELALTSRLEHPSIVSVHDGGTWPDGKPFYVMRLVNGESLDRMIAAAADVGERIALLPHGIAAVDALAYAHAQGIVHRDLKPENVLVGDFGETVVIDWGLAKDLRAATPELVEGPYRELAHGATIGGEVLGTPAYMPPEQAMGDAIDERADVYALGAVFYHLLSGKRPHHGTSVDEVLANVISGPPPALQTVAPAIPADLITIVEKAMARDPDERYPTAGELAGDLKRFQRGQLVGAHRYTVSQLVRRWLRKHRTAVTVGALATIALVIFGIVSVARIVREQRDADSARALADHNRALADDRRTAAEGLVTFMLGDLRDSLEPLGKLAMLELPARRSLAYFDARHELTPDERQSRAVAQQNLGDALRSRGELAAAEAQFRAAAVDRTRIVAEGHDRIEWQYLDAILHADLGDLFAIEGSSPGAIREYRAAIATLATLTATRPADKRGPRSQMQVLEKLGQLLVNSHDPVGAEREYRAAMAIASARVRAAPDDLEAQLDLVGPEHAIADALSARGDRPRALAMYHTTLDRIAAASARKPDDMALLRMTELTQHRIGVTLLAQHDTAGAVQALRTSAALADRLVAHDPDNRGWQYEQALNLARLAGALQAGADAAGAIATYRQAIEVLRALTVRDPSHSAAARDRMVAELELAELHGKRGEWRLAEPLARDAIAVGEQRAKSDPSNHQAQLDLGMAYSGLGGALLELKRPGDALASYARGVELARALAASDPADSAAQQNLQQALIELGEGRCAQRGHGDPDEAYREAVAISARHPDDADWRALGQDARDRAQACRRKR